MKDLSYELPLVRKESVKNGGEKHNHVEWGWAHPFILFYNQTELGIPIPVLLHGDIRCQFNHFYSAFLNCPNYPSTHFSNYYSLFFFFWGEAWRALTNLIEHAFIPYKNLSLRFKVRAVGVKIRRMKKKMKNIVF